MLQKAVITICVSRTTSSILSDRYCYHATLLSWRIRIRYNLGCRKDCRQYFHWNSGVINDNRPYLLFLKVDHTHTIDPYWLNSHSHYNLHRIMVVGKVSMIQLILSHPRIYSYTKRPVAISRNLSSYHLPKSLARFQQKPRSLRYGGISAQNYPDMN